LIGRKKARKSKIRKSLTRAGAVTTNTGKSSVGTQATARKSVARIVAMTVFERAWATYIRDLTATSASRGASGVLYGDDVTAIPFALKCGLTFTPTGARSAVASRRRHVARVRVGRVVRAHARRFLRNPTGSRLGCCL